MKILLVHRLIPKGEQVTFGAVEYYRMQKPIEVLARAHDVQYTTVDSIEHFEDSWLKDFDLIIFSRIIKNPDKTSERLRRLNIVFGMDIDDYWHLDPEHILYDEYQKNQIPALIVKSLSVCDFVTCTTEILADHIRPLNRNVEILPNGIDTEDPVWKVNRVESDRVRFGFTQGTTHIPDILLINKDVARSLYDSKFYHKGQVTLCGFSAEYQKGSIYIGYERELTDDLKPLKFYPNYVHELKILHNPAGLDKPYRRVWAKDVDDFATVYDEIDVSVAPLRDTLFNSCKSNLKMLEAGFKGCAVMVSGVSPFTPFATKENSFLLSEKNFFEWQRYILNNPEVLKDKQQALAEAVGPFSLDKLTLKRKQFYESCVGVQC